MSLPDITRLAEAPASALRAVGRKLASLGVSLAAAQPIVAAAQGVPPMMRKPIRAYHLRGRRDAVGTAMRMFLFSDPVTPEEARAAFGGMLDDLCALGLLACREDGTFVSPFVLGIADDLYILSDELSSGREAAMGFGETTIDLCRAAYPSAPVGRVLDVGCGTGTAALVLARRAREAVGVDINPRAIALARVNAALNDLGNVCFRVGDLFGPVAGETFDLVVSQPPFIPMPSGVDEAAFLYGGPKGDELSLALLRHVAPHLAPGGRAVLFVEWPDHGAEPLEPRLRKALGPDSANLLVLRMPPAGLDEHAAAYAAGLHPGLGKDFEEEALVRRRHFDQMGIRALLPSFVVLEKTAGAPWTDAVPVKPRGAIEITGERLDRLLSARALITGKDDVLFSARLRVPAGTVLAQEQLGPGADVESTLTARFPPGALIAPVALTVELLGLLTSIHEAPTVRAGIERYLSESETEEPLEAATTTLLGAVRRALVQGLLEVA